MGIPAGSFRLPSDFSKRIKALRDRLSLSQNQLAEHLGVSKTVVKRWEQRRSYPSIYYWQQIVQAETEGIHALSGSGYKKSVVYEAGISYNGAADTVLPIDFTASADIVRMVVEGERLTYGHLFNPAFATEISLIEPLPHQHLAVYEHMLKQNRLRFLLTDDAGVGKTIMTGLYIREMLTHRLISRILIVPPAGLVGNWEHEMRHLFNLSFTIVSGSDAKTENPFTSPESDLLIVSIDTLRGDTMFSRLQEAEVRPYDLVIFDEAHKLAADREADLRIRKTDRYRLAESLAGILSEDERWTLGWSCQHLLLLTATPHMGKDYPYYCLWRLLEPDVLATIDAFNAYPPDARSSHFLRRIKEELVYFDGKPIYPPRHSNTFSYDMKTGDVSEQYLYDETTSYIQTYYNRAEILNRSATRLAMSVFQRRLASSTYTLLRSFERRQQKLSALVEAMRSGIQGEVHSLRHREVEQAVFATFLHSQPIGQKAQTRELLVLLGHTRPDKIELEKALRQWTEVSWFLDEGAFQDAETGQIIFKGLPGYWRLGSHPNLKQMHHDACTRVLPNVIEDKLIDAIRKCSSLTASASALGIRVHLLPERPCNIEDDGDFHYVILGQKGASRPGNPSSEARRFLTEKTGPDSPRVYRNAIALAVPSVEGLEATRDSIRKYQGWLQVESQLKGQDTDNNRKQLLELEKKSTQARAAKDVIPDNLSEAWKGNIETTALEIADALSTKAGVQLPWLLVRDALTAAFNARFIERTFGQWPCDYAGARMVRVGQRKEQAQPQHKPASEEQIRTIHQPDTLYTSGNLVAEAKLSVDQMQDLYDQISALTKSCVDFCGSEPTFSLRLEVNAKSQPSKEHIEKINQLLEEVSPELHLK